MSVLELALDLDAIDQQARQIWWGPSLSAVISEIETFREYPCYLLPIIHQSRDSCDAMELIAEHCEARARISLWHSLDIAVICLAKSQVGTAFTQQLEIVRRLVAQYFRWMPCSHAELQFHMCLHELTSHASQYLSTTGQSLQFLQHLVEKLKT